MIKVVTLKNNGKFKTAGKKACRAFLKGLAQDIADGTLQKLDPESQEGGRNPACRECCGRGGVEYCGTHVAICRDGTMCVIG